jgi:hypothetical protein
MLTPDVLKSIFYILVADVVTTPLLAVLNPIGRFRR